MTPENTRQPYHSVEELTNNLNQANIPIDRWGLGTAKTIQLLFDEVTAGACKLIHEGKTIIRVVKSANIRVYYQTNGCIYYLEEEKQVFKDGRVRVRNFPWSVSEKTEFEETPFLAAIRGMKQELGIIEPDLIPESSEHNRVDSESYPGLTTDYDNNYYSVILSPDQFKPEGYCEVQSDKTTYWIWSELKK